MKKDTLAAYFSRMSGTRLPIRDKMTFAKVKGIYSVGEDLEVEIIFYQSLRRL
jgi:hypothetical protein